MPQEILHLPAGVLVTGAAGGIGAALALVLALHVARIETDRALPTPAGRAGAVDEAVSADLFLFLLSRQSSYCTGTSIDPTGGVMNGDI